MAELAISKLTTTELSQKLVLASRTIAVQNARIALLSTA